MIDNEGLQIQGIGNQVEGLAGSILITVGADAILAVVMRDHGDRRFAVTADDLTAGITVNDDILYAFVGTGGVQENSLVNLAGNVILRIGGDGIFAICTAVGA